jgi:hypothetical protein
MFLLLRHTLVLLLRPTVEEGCFYNSSCVTTKAASLLLTFNSGILTTTPRRMSASSAVARCSSIQRATR